MNNNSNNNFLSQKPPVENVKNTINERLNQFRFNPYLCQQTAPPIPIRHSVITKTKYEDTSVELGRKDTFEYISKHSSLFQQDDAFAGILQPPVQHKPKPQPKPQHQSNPQTKSRPQSNQYYQHRQRQHQSIQKPRNIPIDRSPAIFQTGSYNNRNISSNNSLERNLDLHQKSYVPVYEHRPSNTRQEYVSKPVDYQNEFDKRQELYKNKQFHNRM